MHRHAPTLSLPELSPVSNSRADFTIERAVGITNRIAAYLDAARR